MPELASPDLVADPAAPLRGVRVLDLTRLFPFSYATQFLVDLGAEVIKVEAPGGEVGRSYVAPFAATNRGKSSVIVDLRSEEGRDRLLELVATADVLVESFRPSYLASLGLGYAALKAVRPELVMCSVSGYAADSPASASPGHDLNYLLLAGAGLVGPGREPVVPALPVVDVAVASHLCSALTAALFRVARGGTGCHVEIAMADLALSLNTSNLALAAQGPTEQATPFPELVLGDLPCYRLWRTADDRWIALCNLEPKFWATFLQIVGREDLHDLQFATGAEAGRVIEELGAILAARTAAEWASVFAGREVCFSHVLAADEASRAPEFAGRGLVRHLDGVPEVLYPALFDGARPERPVSLPVPGERDLAEQVLDRSH